MCLNFQVAILLKSELPIVVLSKVKRKCVSDIVEPYPILTISVQLFCDTLKRNVEGECPTSVFKYLLRAHWWPLFVLWFVENICEAALATVLPVKVRRHEHAGAALLCRALPPQAVDLAVVVHLVVLQHGQLDLPVLVLDLFGSGVVLLLPLLGTTPEPEHKVKCALLLDVVVGQSASILQLFPSKDQPLLVRGNPLLILKTKEG